VNLGQAFGIDKLRIMQLEDEIADRGSYPIGEAPNPKLQIPNVPGPRSKEEQKLRLRMRDNGRCRTGMTDKLREILKALPHGQDLSCRELAARIPGATVEKVAPLVYSIRGLRRSALRPYRYRWIGEA